MLNALTLVKGAVSTKDLVPVLTHVAFHNGRIHAYDGRVHISAPVDEGRGLECTLPAAPLLASWAAGATLTLGGTFATVTNGALRARLPVGPVTDFPLVMPTGRRQKLKGGWLGVLRVLRPFIGEDASRPWCAGVLVAGKEAYATNNIILTAVALPVAVPGRFVLPVFAVDELLRMGLEPEGLGVEDNAVTLYLPGDVWLRAQVLEDGWPDIAALLTNTAKGANYTAIPPGLADAVQQLRPLCPDPTNPVIRLQNTQVQTQDGAISAVVGGFEGGGLGECAFHAQHLTTVLAVAQEADWSRFPRVPFKGTPAGFRLRGVMVGVLG